MYFFPLHRLVLVRAFALPIPIAISVSVIFKFFQNFLGTLLPSTPQLGMSLSAHNKKRGLLLLSSLFAMWKVLLSYGHFSDAIRFTKTLYIYSRESLRPYGTERVASRRDIPRGSFEPPHSLPSPCFARACAVVWWGSVPHATCSVRCRAMLVRVRDPRPYTCARLVLALVGV